MLRNFLSACIFCLPFVLLGLGAILALSGFRHDTLGLILASVAPASFYPCCRLSDRLWEDDHAG